MRPQFKLNLAAVTAHLVSGQQISNNLYRFKAMVSNTADPDWTTVVANQLGSDMKLVEAACFVKERGAFTAKTDMPEMVEGFAVFAPTTHVIKQSEFASHCGEHKLAHVAGNMYMDADERVWEVREAGSDLYITKTGSDDIEALLASVNNVSVAANQIHPMVTASSFPCAVKLVDEAGDIVDALAVASTRGDAERFTYLTLNNIKAQAQVASVYQVVAFEKLLDIDTPEEFEGFDPLNYWREVYSNDPEMLRTLKENMSM